MLLALIWFSCLVFQTFQSSGICPRAEIPCAGTCAIRLPQELNHGQAAIQCKIQNKRTYMGSRIDAELESTCANAVFGGNDNTRIWSRYKLRDGLVVDESGVTLDSINWGIQYCGGVDQLGNFLPHPCSWNYRAICVSNRIQYDKNNLRECAGEYYWITDRSDLNYELAVQHCKQNNMILATPYTSARKNCFQPVVQGRGIAKAWIDYNITAATQRVGPWDRDYCLKVNRYNQYYVDKCETKLPVFCSSFGELEASGVVVQKGKPAVLTCKCFNCTVNDIEWTDGMTVWRSGDDAGGFSVRSVPDSTGVRSTLTLTETLLDQTLTCVQRTQFSDSVIYRRVEVDVYNLEVTSHFVFHGARITITCKFNNDKHLDIDRVEWSDRRDNTDLSGQARLSYDEATVVSKLEILAEYYTHDVKCTFYAVGEDVTAYSGLSRIIVYKILGEDQSVPADANSTLTCDLKEQEGRSVDLIPPTRVDWKKGDSNYIVPSQIKNPYRAVLVRKMRTGKDFYTCRFLFENGDLLTKTITVTAFDFEGIPALVANGTTATLNCEYSKGKPPDSPLWWEREGVKISNGKKYFRETYEITSIFDNDGFYVTSTTLTVKNASYPATFQCGLRVSEKEWRKDITLKIFMGLFIASNVTITEQLDTNTGEILIQCSVWANPRPNIQLMVGTQAVEGVLSSTYNKTVLTIRVDQTCEAEQIKCLASNNEGTRQTVLRSKLNKKCGFLQKLTLPVKLGIGGALLGLLIIIIVICCCFCRKTKELKEEVEYHREVLSQVDGASTLYSANLSRGGKSLPPKYEDMYSEAGHNDYDPIVKGKTYMELHDTDVAEYNEPFSEAGLMSPRYQRIESDYEPAAPLFMSRSKSRDNVARDMFSPPPMKKSATTLSYQNLKEQSHHSGLNTHKSNICRSAHNLNNTRKFSQPPDSSFKMNPFGKVQRLKSSDIAVDDEVMSITSKIPPSEMSDMTPPVAILSPRGWEIPDDPGRMFSPPTARRPMTQQDRKFSEPGSSPWQEAQEKVSRWNTPPLDKIANPDVYKRPKNGWSTPAGPLSTVGESTGKSSATLDTISVTPTFLTKEKPTSLPKSRPHPEDREADCVSPPPLSVAASSLYHQSSVGPSASQYQPSVDMEHDRQRHNLKNNIFDIDDLSSVDVPENGMDTLDRRVQGLLPAAENFYTPPGSAKGLPRPGLRKKPDRTSHF